MPADEVIHGTDVDESRVRSGPRHAAPRKPLFTRFHMPAGKAMAMAAMPTAVIMGMGFTSSLALADGNSSAKPSAKSLTADEYKNCVTALDGNKDKASPSPSSSASPSGSADGKDGSAEPAPSASPSSPKSSPDKSSSSDSGSGQQATPKPSSTASDGSSGSAGSGGTASSTPSSSASSGGGLLGGIGDTLGGLLTGGSNASSPASPSATASPSSGGSSGGSLSDTVKKTTGTVTGTVGKTVKGVTDTAGKTVAGATKTVGDATKSVGAVTDAVKGAAGSASGSSTDPSGCPKATDAQGGVDNTVPLADDPWYLDASSLLLKGADYKGVVEVRTANGTVKKVLKYVISDGTDIGDLHQTVKDKQAGKTYHVQAGKGTTSTIRGGSTVFYTESISGNLLGLIPVTFTPDSPPPLNIPLIYFTKVKVIQAGQFGGNLHVPGMHVYTTD
ncbi:hypothetical protein [Streptomyces tropicalis]|uniref:Membrane-bound hydrophilic protein n=1 Tax=Streptomyces tropicalis TaxID=3034234 RepID=A0ABT5ZZI1_9ACTN|nr:hypothetical protein [Streptomyces tropicalis]MDF3297803.1 hypothetical protein [Streptomyces tropicalis]